MEDIKPCVGSSADAEMREEDEMDELDEVGDVKPRVKPEPVGECAVPSEVSELPIQDKAVDAKPVLEHGSSRFFNSS
jgi:hypothetical protein